VSLDAAKAKLVVLEVSTSLRNGPTNLGMPIINLASLVSPE
jgi:hypothetical protein